MSTITIAELKALIETYQAATEQIIEKSEEIVGLLNAVSTHPDVINARWKAHQITNLATIARNADPQLYEEKKTL